MAVARAQQPWQLQGGSWAWMPPLCTAPEEGWLPQSPRSASLSRAPGPRPCPAPSWAFTDGQELGAPANSTLAAGTLTPPAHQSHGIAFQRARRTGENGVAYWKLMGNAVLSLFY